MKYRGLVVERLWEQKWVMSDDGHLGTATGMEPKTRWPRLHISLRIPLPPFFWRTKRRRVGVNPPASREDGE